MLLQNVPIQWYVAKKFECATQDLCLGSIERSTTSFQTEVDSKVIQSGCKSTMPGRIVLLLASC